MPELRQNIATREWVIIAPGRARRPEDFTAGTKAPEVLPAYDPDCPFCKGNENKTPPETYRLPGDGGWKVRVTPNKYPALTNETRVERHLGVNGIKSWMSGAGIHEVIIESPFHDRTTALMSEEQVADIIRAYRERYLTALNDKRIELVTIFKNHGENAGTSLEHPHSQLIATPIVPQHTRRRIGEAMAYFDEHGECVYCRILREELKLRERVILETDLFVAVAVYAGTSPFHSWILPRNHHASFGEITDDEITDLARNLKSFLSRLYYGLNNPDYNYVIHTLPGAVRRNDFIHWYLSVVPRITKTAGFELGSGMYINSSLPEEGAKFLREVKI
ncbi:MAG: galactose-1-phosphate uridylyltransferase [Endomicrobiales bacterium]